MKLTMMLCKARQTCVWFAFPMILLCASALAQTTSMQLLTPDTGWALSNSHLFWTTESGNHWRDVTPHVTGHIDDVFFLDTSRGWALLSSSENSDMVSFRLARTADSGQTWTITPIKVPNQEQDELSGSAWLDFIDPLHGWFMLQRNSSAAFSLGRLFATSDGGASWHELGAPIAGRPVFATALDGWISGNSGPKGMYSTHDGGKSWQEDGPPLQELPASLPTRPTYGDVKFADAKHGSLLISLAASNDVEEPRGEALVLYVTDNGGRTWKPDRTLTDKGAFTKHGAALSRLGAHCLVPDSSGSGSTLIVRFNDRKHPNRVTLMTARQGEITTDAAPAASSESVLWRQGDDVAELSFFTSAEGWARTSLGDLLLTTDGGATWKDISPTPVARPAVAPTPTPNALKFKAPSLGSGPLVPAIMGPPAGGTLHYTQHLGFEEYGVAPIATMGTWWEMSPFFDTGIYIGGASHATDVNLTALWVIQAQSQGWGLMPVWSGPQAPCACWKKTATNPCVPFPHIFSTDPATAQAQGTTEAGNAATASFGLGVSGVVFYDMENYTATAGSQCSLAVRAFLTGWVSGMNAIGFPATAVYGNPGPAQRDFSQVAGLTEVWISATPASGRPPRVTIWGLGSGSNALSDDSWNDRQRAHQFLINVGGVTYGGVNTNQAIDYDMENFQIVGGSGTKQYTWVGTSIDLSGPFPNAQSGTFTAVNDVVNASSPTFITNGRTGQMAGYYYESKNVAGDPCTYDAGCAFGIFDDAGSFSSLSIPLGATYSDVRPTGLNNAGQVVGYFCQFSPQTNLWCEYDGTLNPTYLGFLWTPAPNQVLTQVTYAYPGFTLFSGNNDDGEIPTYGVYYDGNFQPVVSNLMYYNGQFTPLNMALCPGQSTGEEGLASISGIDGYGDIVGTYSDNAGLQHGFVYVTEPPSAAACIPLDPPGSLGTYVYGINNQGQILGAYIIDTQRDFQSFLLDNGTYYSLPSGGFAINDATQIVSGCTTGICGYVLNPE